MSMSTIQYIIYFVSRKMDIDLGYEFCYYTSWSRPVHECVRDLCKKKLVENLENNSVLLTTYKLLPNGEATITSFDERKVMFIKSIVNTITRSKLFLVGGSTLKLYLGMAVSLDQVMQITKNTEDKVYLLNNLRALGWFPTLTYFAYVYKEVMKFRLPYKREVSVESRGKDS